MNTQKHQPPALARARTGQKSKKSPPPLADSEKKLSDLIKDEPSVRKIVRRSAVLADLCTDEDLEADARVLREAVNANHRHFDLKTKSWIETPDHKTRLAATTLRRAFVEGTPVKREISITSTFTSAEDILARLRESPEAQRTFAALSSQGIKVLGEGQVVEMSVQKTG